MEQQLKQRLVGVGVIFSLAVIFLPMLLDGSGTRPQSLSISIPSPPASRSYEIIEDKVIELKLKAESLSALESTVVDEVSDPPGNKIVRKTEVDTQQPVAAEKEKTAVMAISPAPVVPPLSADSAQKSEKEQTGGVTWVIQVGSFTDKDKAYLQRDKLKKSGLPAVFIEKFQHNGVLSYRVRMGPFITREEAKVIQNKLLAKYNIKGLSMRYEK